MNLIKSIKDKVLEYFVWIFYFLMCYPLFYFSYKYSLFDFGGTDFVDYYYLYKDWDFEKVRCPFNMRIISSFLIHLFYLIGFKYDTENVFMLIHQDRYDNQVFFNAILVNFIGVFFTCIMIYKTVYSQQKNFYLALLSGILYLLGFGTLIFSFKPLSESIGILIFAIAFYFYIKRSAYVYLLLLISVFQREYILFAIGIMSFIEYFFKKDKFYLKVLVASIVFFGFYYYLRMTVFYTPDFVSQIDIKLLLKQNLSFQNFKFGEFFRQSFLISNLFIFYLVILFINRLKEISINYINFIIVLNWFLFTVIMSIVAHFGNNAGRYFYYTSPALIYFISCELKKMFEKCIIRVNN